jgi:hypothetical protein
VPNCVPAQVVGAVGGTGATSKSAAYGEDGLTTFGLVVLVVISLLLGERQEYRNLLQRKLRRTLGEGNGVIYKVCSGIDT